MNNTTSDDNMIVTTTTIIIGTFMIFFMCFALKMCFLNSYVLNTRDEASRLEPILPPVYDTSVSPPVYQDSPPSYDSPSLSPPLYTDLNNYTQTLAPELHPQVPPEHRD